MCGGAVASPFFYAKMWVGGGAFRRARRAQSENYRASRKEWAQTPKENRQTPLTNAGNSGIVEGQSNKSSNDGLPKLEVSSKQIGKKNKKHMKEFGLDVKNADDRKKYEDMFIAFRNSYDEVGTGEWAGQEDEILFFIKGEHVMLVKKNGEFISLFKGGHT